MKKEFDSKPTYYKNFIKTKIKYCVGESTDFHDKEIPEVGSHHPCLALILIDSVLKKDENYYLQVCLKNVNTLKKKKRSLDTLMMT